MKELIEYIEGLKNGEIEFLMTKEEEGAFEEACDLIQKKAEELDEIGELKKFTVEILKKYTDDLSDNDIATLREPGTISRLESYLMRELYKEKEKNKGV